MKIKCFIIGILLLATVIGIQAAEREKYNFNSAWCLKVGDIAHAEAVRFNDADWKKVTLPHAFNEDEAFKVNIKDLTDGVKSLLSLKVHAKELTFM